MGKRRNRQKIDPTPQIVNIDSIAHDGRGVGRLVGIVLGALQKSLLDGPERT